MHSISHRVQTPCGVWNYRIGRSTVVIHSPDGTRIVKVLDDFLSRGENNVSEEIERWINQNAVTAAVA